jgi:gamma-glutamylcyclotransferase (GGCT)/AIG2-like uncharacterized protein YtfP
MTMYFAYGSNLDREDWAAFCARHGADPDCLRPLGTALLPDAELVFNYRSPVRGGGALNLAPRRGQVVQGVLFEVTGEGWEVLDAKEGVASGRYARSARVAIAGGGATVPVVTYEVVRERLERHVAPTAAYVETVSRGLAAHGLSRAPLDAAARGAPSPPLVEGLFVYGTLMRGESRFPAMAAHRPRRVLLARGPGRLHETSGDYPMMDLEGAAATDAVRGEYMAVAGLAPALETLDAVEDFAGYGHPANEYVRTLVEIDAGEGRPRLAWTYAACDRRVMGPRIASGCWRSHRGVHEDFLRRLTAAHHAGDDAFLRSLHAAVRDWVLPGAGQPPTLSLDAVARALDLGALSEHRLAEVSGRWTALIG